MNELLPDTLLDVVAYDDKFNIVREKIMTKREYLEVIKKPTKFHIKAYQVGFRKKIKKERSSGRR